MNKKPYFLTKEGVAELEAELAELKEERLEIAEKLKVARSYGDLSENAEYHNARDEQVQVELRIKEIENILQNIKIIEHSGKINGVALGCTVELSTSGKDRTYTIVGSVEADPTLNKISDESPIGQALLGKKIGDKVEINTPAGPIVCTIKQIK